MLYDESRMALTKERLEDLRKEKKLSFEQASPVRPYSEHEHRISGGFCRFL